jgi:hypothetical protein
MDAAGQAIGVVDCRNSEGRIVVGILNLIVLCCIDIGRTRAFYESFDLAFELHRHGTGPDHYGAIDEHATVIELYAASERNPADRCGVGFGVPDLDRTAADLRSRGFEPGPTEVHPWGTTFVVRDPDGRRVEVKLLQSELRARSTAPNVRQVGGGTTNANMA